MNQREQLELAAKACEIKHVMYPKATDEGIFTDYASWWNPLTDQADSDRMGCDLEICITFVFGRVAAAATYNRFTIGMDAYHDNTIEGRRAAVREARLLVAVEIGRAMK
jgi:hypothetical protein